MTLLLTGATGRTGRYIAEAVAARGLRARALVRNTAAAGWLRDLGIETVAGDMADTGSLAAAFAGVEQALLLAANSPGQVAIEKGFIDTAKAAGVQRIVKYSAIAAGGDEDYRFARWHGEAERHLLASGLRCCLVRPGYFMQNFLMSAASIAAEGAFYLPRCAEPVSLVDVRDAADVTVACLLDPAQDGCIRTVTGPESLTMDEVATRMSAVLGREIRYVGLPDADFAAGMAAAGAPDWLAGGMIEFFGGARRGTKDHLSTSVQRLLGREPIRFERFVAEHASAFGA
ncbi:MAG: SDR family oxidoreductase [Gammaproteobacteria bacterium]